MLGVGDAGGDLDPHHLVGPALALSIDAVVQAEHPHHVLWYLTGLVADQHPLELVDVGLLSGVDYRRIVDLDRDHRTFFGVLGIGVQATTNSDYFDPISCLSG